RPSPFSPSPPHPAPGTRRKSRRRCFHPHRSAVWHPRGDKRTPSRGRRWPAPSSAPPASPPPSPGQSPDSPSPPSPPAGNAFGEFSEGKGIAGLRKDVDVRERRLHPFRLRQVSPEGKERVEPDHSGGPAVQFGHRAGQPVRLPGVQAVAGDDDQAVPAQH